jgi:hypothetical protein
MRAEITTTDLTEDLQLFFHTVAYIRDITHSKMFQTKFTAIIYTPQTIDTQKHLPRIQLHSLIQI